MKTRYSDDKKKKKRYPCMGLFVFLCVMWGLFGLYKMNGVKIVSFLSDYFPVLKPYSTKLYVESNDLEKKYGYGASDKHLYVICESLDNDLTSEPGVHYDVEVEYGNTIKITTSLTRDGIDKAILGQSEYLNAWNDLSASFRRLTNSLSLEMRVNGVQGGHAKCVVVDEANYKKELLVVKDGTVEYDAVRDYDPVPAMSSPAQTSSDAPSLSNNTKSNITFRWCQGCEAAEGTIRMTGWFSGQDEYYCPKCYNELQDMLKDLEDG